MNVDVADMAEWRRRRDAVPTQFEGDEPAICPCGSWFFELRAATRPDGSVVRPYITLRAVGTVSGYTGVPHCITCGAPLLIG